MMPLEGAMISTAIGNREKEIGTIVKRGNKTSAERRIGRLQLEMFIAQLV